MTVDLTAASNPPLEIRLLVKCAPGFLFIYLFIIYSFLLDNSLSCHFMCSFSFSFSLIVTYQPPRFNPSRRTPDNETELGTVICVSPQTQITEINTHEINKDSHILMVLSQPRWKVSSNGWEVEIGGI